MLPQNRRSSLARFGNCGSLGENAQGFQPTETIGVSPALLRDIGDPCRLEAGGPSAQDARARSTLLERPRFLFPYP